MKFDISKVLLIPIIFISLFLMTKYESYGGKGDYVLNDYSYMLPNNGKIASKPADNLSSLSKFKFNRN